MIVYVVTFKSSGESWHTAVCEADMDVVKPVMASYGITMLHYADKGGEYQHWLSPTDRTQEAILQRRTVIQKR